MSMLRGLCRAVRRTVRRIADAVGRAVRAVGKALRQAAGVVADAVAEAAQRHRHRWSRDDQYRAMLLSAVGALLSTLVPPALAAAVATGIGAAGLLDPPVGGRAAPARPDRGYGPSWGGYRSSADDRPRGAPLWEQEFGFDDD